MSNNKIQVVREKPRGRGGGVSNLIDYLYAFKPVLA